MSTEGITPQPISQDENNPESEKTIENFSTVADLDDDHPISKTSQRVKSTMGVLTMVSPLVLLGALCTVYAVWHQINGTKVTSERGGVITISCTDTRYLLISNGVCKRGTPDGYDIDEACITWDNTDEWAAIDTELASHNNEDDKVFNLNSNLQTEVTEVWANINFFCNIACYLSSFNLFSTLIAADLDLDKYNIDTEKWTMLTSGIFNLVICIMFVDSILKANSSDLLNQDSWTTDKCKYTIAPSFGYYLLVVAGFFAGVGAVMSLSNYYYVYVSPPENEQGRGTFKPRKAAVAPVRTDVESGKHGVDDSDDSDEEEPESEVPKGHDLNTEGLQKQDNANKKTTVPNNTDSSDDESFDKKLTGIGI
jgi:hypothetical protein